MASKEIMDMVKQLAKDKDVKKLISNGLNDVNLDKIVEIAKTKGMDFAPSELKKALEAYEKIELSPLGKLLKRLFGR